MQGFSYNQLLQALQDWPENTATGATEYVSNIPRVIQLAELRVVKDLNLEIFDYLDSNLTATMGDTRVAKPDDLIQTRNLWLILDTGERVRLSLRSFGWLQRYAPNLATLARPRYFAEFDELEYEIRPAPDDDYSIEAHYVRRPLGLSATNQNTWLGDKVGDLIFCAALMEAEHFIKADDRYGDMKTKYYEELLPIARAELRRSLRMGDYDPFKPAAKAVGKAASA